MKKNNRFAVGSGCYVCKGCGYRTRDTGIGANVGLCELCYEIGGWENQMMDNPPESALYQEAQTQHQIYSMRLEARNAQKKA